MGKLLKKQAKNLEHVKSSAINKKSAKNPFEAKSSDRNSAGDEPYINNKMRKMLKRQAAQELEKSQNVPKKSFVKLEKNSAKKTIEKSGKTLKLGIKATKPQSVNQLKKKIKSKDFKSDVSVFAGNKPDETTNDKESDSKTKTGQNLDPSFADAPVFDESNFFEIVKQDNIKKIVKALPKLVEDEVKTKKNSIFGDYKYVLNICCFRIAESPRRIVKMKIKHSMAQSEETVLIVKDLHRGLKVDYEPTIHHYEDLLREKGVNNIKNIMPFNQLKREYSTFEMKRKLANLYEYFLCDGAIVNHVNSFLGKTFSSKLRCTPYPVNLSKSDKIKSEINKGLHKTCYKQGEKGTTIAVNVGTHIMTPGQIADNIMCVVNQLKTVFPGGLPNIRNIMLRINIKGTSSLPLYISMGKPIEETPNIIGTREIKMNKLKEEANKILSRFEITQNGDFKPLKRKHSAETIEKAKKIKKDKSENVKDEIELKASKTVNNNEESLQENDNEESIQENDNEESSDNEEDDENDSDEENSDLDDEIKEENNDDDSSGEESECASESL